MIVWRGWGWLVISLPILFFMTAAMVLDSYGFNGMARDRAAAVVYRDFAGSFAASTLLLWPLVRRRNRTAPGVDHLAFIPMRFWLPIGLVAAAGFLVASFIPAALRAFE